MKKILLGGLVVLLALFVVGCSTGVGDEDVKGGNKHKTWTTSNDSTTTYKRMYQTFGSSKNFTEAVIEINAKLPQNGWSGILFGMDENEDDTVNFYNISFKASDGVPYYYVSRFENVDMENFADNTTESYGSENELVAPKEAENLTLNDDGSLTVFVELSWVESGGAGLWSVQFGKRRNNLDEDISDVLATSTDKGKLAAYGQITKATTEGTAIMVETTWDLLSSSPSVAGYAEE